MRYTIKELMEDGETWEEAEDRLSRWAEEYADAERDRLAEENLNGAKANKEQSK